MSSPRKEDLDARRDASDVEVAAARPEVHADAQSIPPNSMILEKTAAPIESLVVPAATQVPIESVQLEPTAFQFKSDERGSDEVSPPQEAHSQLLALDAAGEQSVVVPEMHPVSLDGRTVTGDVPLLPSRTLPTSPAEAIQPYQSGQVPSGEQSPNDAATQPPEPSKDEFAAVAAQSQQLAEDAPSGSHAVPIERTSLESVVTTDISSDQRQVQPAVGHSHSRVLRIAVWSAAVLASLVVGYWALHGKDKVSPNVQVLTPSRAVAPSPLSVSQNQVHDIAVNAAVNAKIPSAPVEVSARAAKAAAEPRSVAQAESFADAFVKHAASANSSWADIKKRPRAADAQSTNRSNASAMSASNDNPLGLLDQLEKVRKAKKQTSSQP